MMGMKIQVFVTVSWFSIDVYNEFTVVSRDWGIKERYLTIAFVFNGERNVIDGVQFVMEG